MDKLNRAQKCSILGPQNLGSSGGPGLHPTGTAPARIMCSRIMCSELKSARVSCYSVY